MIIFIKSAPYESENVIGALFIALSSAEGNIPTKVIFMGTGKWNMIPNQNTEDHISAPPISDLILQLVGMVEFYCIRSQTAEDHELLKKLDEKSFRVAGIKLITYSEAVEFLMNDPKNILIL